MTARRTIVVVAGEHTANTSHMALVGAMMRRCSAVIDQLESVRACTMWLRPEQIDNLGQLRPTERGSAPVILLGLGIDRALRARAHAAARGVTVVTDHDASAIALAAATLVCVSNQGRSTDQARVLIAGANRLPALTAFLREVGAGEVTSWNTQDAQSCPLSSVVATMDVVIDLVGRGPETGCATTKSVAATAQPGLSSIGATGDAPLYVRPDPVADSALVLPALVQVIAAVPDLITDPSGFKRAFREMGYACALELVMATTPSQTALPRASAQLTLRLTDAATRSLPAQTEHPSGRSLTAGTRWSETSTGTQTAPRTADPHDSV